MILDFIELLLSGINIDPTRLEPTVPILQKGLVRGDSSTVSCPKFNSQELTKIGIGIPSWLCLGP